MRQRLYQTVTAVSDTSGNIAFRFPPVPQGLVWSGCIALYASNPASVFNTKFIDGIRWSLTRNATPVISYTGEAVVYDVQAVGQEVMTLTGIDAPVGTSVTATWYGFSDDAISAPLLYPRIAGTNPPYTQVYTSTPGAPLDIVHFPDPSNVQVVQKLNGLASTTMDMIPNGQSVGYRIWSAAINASCTNNATALASIPWLASIQINGTPILSLEPMVIQTDSSTASVSLDLYGLQTGIGQGIQLATGAFTGGTSVRANATVVVSSYV